MTAFFADEDLGSVVTIECFAFDLGGSLGFDLGYRRGVIREISLDHKVALISFDDPLTVQGSSIKLCVSQGRANGGDNVDGGRIVSCENVLVPNAKEELPHLIDLLSWWRGGWAFTADLNIGHGGIAMDLSQ
jgi:hypothetical protein